MSMTNTPPLSAGHRGRVRSKFLQSFGKELHEYELLEILLFAAIPRQDTKALAKKLLAKFGDLSAVINADVKLLQEVDGVGEAVVMQIKVIAEIIHRILKKSASEKTVLNNWQALLNYANNLLKNLNHEVFHVLFLDKKHQLIADELMAVGENDHVVVSSRMVAKKALLLSAASIILLHNHPSGDLRPSAADLKVTQEIAAALHKLEVKVLDHLIIGLDGHFSFKQQGLL